MFFFKFRGRFLKLDIYKCPFLKIGGRELKFSYIIVFTYILKKEKYLPLPTVTYLLCCVVFFVGCFVVCLAALLAMVVASVLGFFFTVFPFAFAVIIPAIAVAASATLVLVLVLVLVPFLLINTL